MKRIYLLEDIVNSRGQLHGIKSLKLNRSYHPYEDTALKHLDCLFIALDDHQELSQEELKECEEKHRQIPIDPIAKKEFLSSRFSLLEHALSDLIAKSDLSKEEKPSLLEIKQMHRRFLSEKKVGDLFFLKRNLDGSYTLYKRVPDLNSPSCFKSIVCDSWDELMNGDLPLECHQNQIKEKYGDAFFKKSNLLFVDFVEQINGEISITRSAKSSHKPMSYIGAFSAGFLILEINSPTQVFVRARGNQSSTWEFSITETNESKVFDFDTLFLAEPASIKVDMDFKKSFEDISPKSDITSSSIVSLAPSPEVISAIETHDQLPGLSHKISHDDEQRQLSAIFLPTEIDSETDDTLASLSELDPYFKDNSPSSASSKSPFTSYCAFWSPQSHCRKLSSASATVSASLPSQTPRGSISPKG